MHAVRMTFQILGAEIPNPSQLGPARIPVSQPIRVDGLIQKTIEIRALAAQLGSNPIIVQGSITCVSNTEATNQANGWFNILTVSQAGLHKIVLPDPTAGSSSEPSINALRLLATEAPQQGPTIFPPSLIASFSGLWLGSGDEAIWMSRHLPYVG